MSSASFLPTTSPVSFFLYVTYGIFFYLVSFAIYNIFFHPLASYPGPWLAKISPVYNFVHAYRGDLHLDILRCHQEHGKVVRYAPNRLLFSSAEALKGKFGKSYPILTALANLHSADVYGHSKTLEKSKGYNPHPYYPETPNLFTCVDKLMAARKKRFMNQALNENLLKCTEQHIITHVRNLCEAVLQGGNDDNDESSPRMAAPRDMAEWTYYYSLDVVSHLSLGQPFGLLTNPNLHWLIPALTDGNRFMYLQFAWPDLLKSKLTYWVDPVRWIFPAMSRESWKFAQLASKFRKERKIEVAENIAKQDIVSLLEAATDPKTGERMTEEEIWTEALTLVRAGGDTVSTALAATFFYLSRSSRVYARLANEVRIAFPTVDSIRQGPALSSCQYLYACLNESMRLSPPAPGAFWRQVLPGGARIDGVWVPGGCEVGVGLYALNHNELYFPDPWAFRPERFLHKLSPSTSMFPCKALAPDDQNAVPDAKVIFAPFLLGPRSCPARQLAYLEMLLLVARIMWDMDFWATGTEGQGRKGTGCGREREREFQLWDVFSADKTGPVLQFQKRK